jgi:hypothetical protein
MMARSWWLVTETTLIQILAFSSPKKMTRYCKFVAAQKLGDYQSPPISIPCLAMGEYMRVEVFFVKGHGLKVGIF